MLHSHTDMYGRRPAFPARPLVLVLVQLSIGALTALVISATAIHAAMAAGMSNPDASALEDLWLWRPED